MALGITALDFAAAAIYPTRCAGARPHISGWKEEILELAAKTLVNAAQKKYGYCILRVECHFESKTVGAVASASIGIPAYDVCIASGEIDKMFAIRF